jgi:DNA polymerase-3 subunit epsilon
VIEGTTVRPADTDLAVRARELLAAGPMDAVELIGQVCRMSGTPAVVAEHLALTLFAGRREFVRDGRGRWMLAGTDMGRAAPAPSSLAYGDQLSLGGLAPAAGASDPARPARRRVREPRVPTCGRTPLDALDYVVVDVETTGSCAWRSDRITEIALVHVRGGAVVEQFESLVNPERSIPPIITALTNITWEMVRDAPRFGELCDRIVPMLTGRVFVAHNAEFDWRFVTAEIGRATGERLDGERLCTVRLARRLLPQLRSRRLDALAHWYGITIHGRHRAGGDARATAALLLRLLAELADHGCLTFEAARELLARRTARARRGRRRAMPRGMTRDDIA